MNKAEKTINQGEWDIEAAQLINAPGTVYVALTANECVKKIRLQINRSNCNIDKAMIGDKLANFKPQYRRFVPVGTDPVPGHIEVITDIAVMNIESNDWEFTAADCVEVFWK